VQPPKFFNIPQPVLNEKRESQTKKLKSKQSSKIKVSSPEINETAHFDENLIEDDNFFSRDTMIQPYMHEKLEF
jgi:hypothetical protein